MISRALNTIQLESSTATPDHLQLARQLELLISKGELKEGERLPNTTELVRLWNTNITRIQRAMDVLVANGLLQRTPRRGTFVSARSDRPMIGILSGPELTPEANHFHRLLVTMTKKIVDQKGLTAKIYDSIGEENTPEGISAHKDLKYDLRHNRFNGFVIISSQLGGTPLEQAEIEIGGVNHPFVTYGSPKPSVDVQIDFADYARSSTQWLIEKGCRNIVYFPVGVPRPYREDSEAFESVLHAAGLVAPKLGLEQWTRSSSGTRERHAYEQLLPKLKDWQKRGCLPDAYILPDGVEARGIIAAVQTSLEKNQQPPYFVVATHSESDPFYVLPAARYSISTEEIAENLINRLNDMILNNALPPDSVRVKGNIRESYC